MSPMDPLVMSILLLVLGIALLVGEALLPTYGVVGGLGVVALGGSVYYAFQSGAWVGVGLLVVMLIGSPFFFVWMMEAWPKTPVGRRLVLSATVPEVTRQQCVPLEEKGTTVTELRPMGECDFGDRRCEAISEYGVIPAGTLVKVVAHDGDGRPVVRSA